MRMTKQTTDDRIDNTRTLVVRVDSAEQTRNEFVERLQAMEQGEDTSSRHVLDLPNEAAVSRLTSETNLSLIRMVANEKPRSMRAAADAVDRGYKEVHTNLTELAELGVIDLIAVNGRTKRPEFNFDRIVVDLPMDDDDRTEPATV